jgi:hypothetical protein
MDKAQLERMEVGEYFHNEEEWRIESKTYFNTVVCVCTRAGQGYKLGQSIEWRTTVARFYNKGRHPNCGQPNSLFKNIIIEAPTVDIYYGGELVIPQANEYTVRNFLIAARKGGEFNGQKIEAGELSREKIQIMEVFNGETSIHTLNEHFMIMPQLRSRLLSFGEELKYKLIL